MLKLLRYDPSKLFSSYAIYCNTSRDWKCTSSYITIQFCSLADVSLPNLTFHEITVFDWNYIEFWREWRDWFVFWQRTNTRLNLFPSEVGGSYQVSFQENFFFHLVFLFLLQDIMHYALSLLCTRWLYLHRLEFLCSYRKGIELYTSKLFDRCSIFANVLPHR